MAGKRLGVYMLCEDSSGFTIQAHGILNWKNIEPKPWNALKGGLFRCRDDDKQPLDKLKISLVSLDDSNHFLDIEKTKIKRIRDPAICGLLEAVDSTNNKFHIFCNEQYKLEAALNAIEGMTKVAVEIDAREYVGVLKYRGRLKKKNGIFLGIQLQVRLQNLLFCLSVCCFVFLCNLCCLSAACHRIIG